MSSIFRKKLSGDQQQKFKAAMDCENIVQASAILVQAGMVEDAISLCETRGNPTEAIDIAMKFQRYELAERIADEHNLTQKLADIYLLQNKNEEAAEVLLSLKQFDKAAKIFFKIKQFDKAAVLYAKIGQFMNAVMCYQKSGNQAKQLEMQVRAFESELALANGDLQATSVSRTMAIYAAKAYLKDPETRQKGLDILNKAQALEETAQELAREGQNELAAICFEAGNLYEQSYRGYLSIGDFENAYRMAQATGNTDLEIATLKRFKKFYKLGQKYIAARRIDDALSALKQVDSNDPNYVNALELQGDIYCKQKNYSDAVSCYESLLWQQLPSEKLCRIAYKAGYSYEILEDYDNALRHYQKVQSIDAGFHDIGATINSLIDKQKQLRQESMRADNLETDETCDSPVKPKTLNEPDDFGEKKRRSVATGQLMHSGTRSRGRISTVIIGDTEVAAIGSDRYKVVEEVAHGGMGVVYKATDTILMRTVALKVLSNKLRDNPVALEYFMREARASAQLQHINIVTVYDIGSLNDGNIYMAMEFIDGKNLKQIISQTGPFPTKFLLQVAMHACRGLQYAHENGIIHRDIKSSNMMIAKKDKTLKICDLGLAKFASDDRNSTQAVGTPYYMSPEQVLGNEIDRRSDIYSLGVTLFELSTGVLPFVKGDLPYKHVHEPPPAPSTFNQQINPDVEAIILKMMEKKPDDRYATCNDVMAALKAVRL